MAVEGQYLRQARGGATSWIAGAAVLLAVFGVILWAMSGNNFGARFDHQANTGISKSSPPPGDPSAPLSGNPSRP